MDTTGFGIYSNGSGGGGGLPPDGIYGQITVSGTGTTWMVNQTADVNIGSFVYIGSGVKADSSAGAYLYSNSGSQAMSWGAGGGQNVTFYDGVKLDAKTASKIVTTDASKNLETTLALTIDGTLAANSDSNVPSEKATKTYADSKVTQNITDGVTATAPSENAVFDALAGKQNSLGYTPENVANKSTDTSLGVSDTLYPTQNAVKTYVDNNIGDPTFIIVEKNIATLPRKSGKFTITSSGLTIGKQVIISQAAAVYTGKGNLVDECEMDGVLVKGVVTSGTNIDCYWNSETYVKGNFKFNYLISA